eukprot:1833563-Pyramimonas_sp.AAC.1
MCVTKCRKRKDLLQAVRPEARDVEGGDLQLRHPLLAAPAVQGVYGRWAPSASRGGPRLGDLR